MSRILLVASTTGYQTRAFGDAAARLGVELVFATDRCHVLDDPWRDQAVPVRFYDEEGSIAAIVAVARDRPVDGVIGLGDRPAVLAALAAEALGLRGNPPGAVRAASNKLLTRRAFERAHLPCPWFLPVPLDVDVERLARRIDWPVVIKPLSLSASRGVIRADDVPELKSAVARLKCLLRLPELRADRDPAGDTILVEQFVPGPEFALDGVLERGELQVLALFDKPDPLDGPYFEETVYVTPSRCGPDEQREIERAVARSASALGLVDGPLHAECRVNDTGVFMLEVAARPIGGLCSRALRFQCGERGGVPLEELLLRHALGESIRCFVREASASAVMMIPIPGDGLYRAVEGVEAARAVPGVDDLVVTAKPGQRLVPFPEGASYPGFIFSRAAEPNLALAAVREAHRRLNFVLDPIVTVI